MLSVVFFSILRGPLPKGHSRTKTLRDSELLRRSVFTTPPPQIYYAANASLRAKMSAIPWIMVCPHTVRRDSANHHAILNLLRRAS